MKIFIDADGCPVVDLTLKIANKNQVEAVILCDTSHEFRRDGVETVVVSKGADSVDFALVNRIQSGDIAVTQDYGLAAMCMAKGAIPISQNGMIYTDENIEALLLARHTAKKIRNAGGKLKGSRKRTPQQNVDFEKALDRLISTLLSEK
ncbi:MAG: YaiI/YqxD family protein [Clostridiales bacterium]|nr:YaiI/YqxD family protein [Clostridiales bacterium]